MTVMLYATSVSKACSFALVVCTSVTAAGGTGQLSFSATRRTTHRASASGVHPVGITRRCTVLLGTWAGCQEPHRRAWA